MRAKPPGPDWLGVARRALKPQAIALDDTDWRAASLRAEIEARPDASRAVEALHNIVAGALAERDARLRPASAQKRVNKDTMQKLVNALASKMARRLKKSLYQDIADILTEGRAGEVLGACWDELDLPNALKEQKIEKGASLRNIRRLLKK
jgi:hypothetical protein